MKKKARKGQVAMEYLITYGWALVIIAVIMFILYSTIFRPEFYIAEKCEMAPGLECRPETTSLKSYESAGITGSELKMQLTNSMGYPISINSITFITKDLAVGGEKKSTVSCTPSCFCEQDSSCGVLGSWYVNNTMSDGDKKDIDVVFYGNQPTSGVLYRIKFIMNYTIVETGTSHITAGIINVRAS